MKIHSMHQKLLPILFSLIFLSCSKSNSEQVNGTMKYAPVFSSSRQAFDEISQYLSEYYPNEKLINVGNISNIHSLNKTMAIVFYQTNTGEHNMLVEKTESTVESFSQRVTVCEGTECNCKVTAIIDNQGNVTIDCNCGSCVMISTEL